MPSSIHPRKASASTRFLLLTFSISCSLMAVDAQNFTPTIAWASAYTAQEGQSFIIQGGSNGTYTIPQTFSIDLSTSWDTSNVPYKRLKDGPSDYRHSASLLRDKQTWLVVSNDTGYEYDISMDSWTSLGHSEFLSRTHGLGAVTDPSTGFVYIPNGYISNGTIQMARYDMTANILDGKPMSLELGNLVNYSIAWSAQARKMIVYGGAINGTNNVNNNMYTWDNANSWTVVTPQGDQPLPRQSACMVPAYNGAKMILFGGLSNHSNSVLSDIFILDTATMSWTKGTDAGAAGARSEAACTVSNDLFIAWGGGGISTVINSNITVVYNIKKDLWQSYYSPFPENYVGKGSSSGSGTTTSSSVIIIGVVGGIIVLLALIIWILIYRRKRKQRNHITVGPSHPHHGGSSTPNMYMTVAGDYNQSKLTGLTQHKPWQQEPWQQHQQLPQQLSHQGSQPLSMPMSMQSQQTPYSSPYPTYQPHVIHDFHQPQQPNIFQPQYALPASTASTNSPSTDLYQQPTVYYPLESSITLLTPEPKQQLISDALTLVSSRPPQNPQLGNVPVGYQDDDYGHRRNPQGLQEREPS